MSSKPPALSKRVDVLEATVLELSETVSKLTDIVTGFKNREKQSQKAKKAQSIDDEPFSDTECIIKAEKDDRFISIDKLKLMKDCVIRSDINQRCQYCTKDSKLYCGSCGTVDSLLDLQNLKLLCFCIDHRKYHVCGRKMKMKKVLDIVRHHHYVIFF
jgi:hypothetical protein